MSKRLHRITLAGIAIAALVAPALAQPDGQKNEGEAPPTKKARAKDQVLRISGELTDADEKEPVIVHSGKKREGSYRKVHLYKMSPGRSYIIEMIDPQSKGPNNPQNLDPYLRLEDSKGVELGFSDDVRPGSDQNARIIFTPTKEDTYRIIVTTCNREKTGPYVLTVRPVVVGSVPGMLQLPMPVDVGDLTITPILAWGLNSNTGSNASDSHGYFEYRFLVENNSETDSHSVRITLPHDKTNPRGHFLQAVQQAVEVKPGAERYITLLQPDLPFGGQGGAAVELDGRRQTQTISINLLGGRGNRANPPYGGSRGIGSSPIILVPDEGLVQVLRSNAQKSAVGVQTRQPVGVTYSSTTSTYAEPGPYYQKSYTYYETVRFNTAPLLPEGWSRNWLGYTSWDGVALTAADWKRLPPEARAALTQYVECGGSLLINGPVKLPDSWSVCLKEEFGFDHYFPGFGQCLVAKKVNFKTKEYDIAVWDPDDWRLIFKSWERSIAAWQQMRSPTEANKEFEVVEGLAIPVRALFIAMLVFVVVIGPVNVYWLSRTKRRIWLLWTVPAFSLATCLLLVGFMTATEGWQGHVRAEGITILDEPGQRATTIGWVGFYCPISPAGGLRFSTDTELTPHFNFLRMRSDAPHPHTVEWADQQILAEGWAVPKIPIHFMTRRSEKRLEQVALRKHDDGSFSVVNRLGATIDSIHVAAGDGKIYTARAVVAGPETKLEPTDLKAAGRLDKLSEAFAATWVKGSEQMAERPQDFLRPGCYVAVLNDSPFLEPGLEQSQTRKLRSVVFGIMRSGE